MRSKVSDGTIDDIDGAKLYLKKLIFSKTPTVFELGLDTRARNALHGGGFFLICDLEETTPEILKKQRGMGEQSYELIVERLRERGVTISEFGRRVSTPISELNIIVDVEGVQLPRLKVDRYKRIKDRIAMLESGINLIDILRIVQVRKL